MYNKVKYVRDAIKNCLENEENFTCIICPYSHFVDECMKNLLSDASEYIQQLENHIGELTEKVAQLEAAQPKWISVDDPPKEGGRYLVLLDNGKCCDAVYDTCINSDCKFGEWHKLHDSQSLGLFDRAWMSYKEVTHWMPMIPLQKENAYEKT